MMLAPNDEEDFFYTFVVVVFIGLVKCGIELLGPPELIHNLQLGLFNGDFLERNFPFNNLFKSGLLFRGHKQFLLCSFQFPLQDRNFASFYKNILVKPLEVVLLGFKLLLELHFLCLKFGIPLLHDLGYLSQLVSMLLALVKLLDNLTEFCVRSRLPLNRLINVDVSGAESGKRLRSQEDEVGR